MEPIQKGKQTNKTSNTCAGDKGKQTNKQTSRGSTCGGADAGGDAELRNMWSPIRNASEYAEELRRCIRDALEKCRVTPGRDCTKWMHHSNDCPNLHYCIQPMQYSKELCRDLAFLVPLGLKESNLGALVP